VQPTTVSLELDNRHGNYTPENPRSAHHSHVRRGTPCRLSLPGAAAEPYMRTRGLDQSHASTPDHASLDITGDITASVDVEPRSWRPGKGEVLAAKWSAPGDQLSWALSRLEDGRLLFSRSPNGTFASRFRR
jgi:hypothetical protein